MRERRPTLSDVARLAGVSLGSASKAISDPDAVRPRTREAVQVAAASLGYLPNGTARALAMRRSTMVGIVLPTINNPVFASFVHVLQRRLGKGGYHLLVQAHEYDPAAELDQIERLIQRGIDGLVLVGSDHDPALFALLERTGLPYMMSWSADEAPPLSCVGFSNRGAMREVAEHLIGLGHRRVAMISGDPAHNERARSRIAGVRDLLPDAHVLIQPFSIAGGRAGLRAALALDPAPTAIICATDLMAAGAISEARAMGLGVPGDVSITGFDDIDLAAVTEPALTTVHAPIEEMGEAIGERILARMRGEEALASRIIPGRLVRRTSTGPAR